LFQQPSHFCAITAGCGKAQLLLQSLHGGKAVARGRQSPQQRWACRGSFFVSICDVPTEKKTEKEEEKEKRKKVEWYAGG
jgi:hypothetical protein